MTSPKRRARNRWCAESGAAVGLMGEPGDKWCCLLCRRWVRLRLVGEHVVIGRHQVLADLDTTRPALAWWIQSPRGRGAV